MFCWKPIRLLTFDVQKKTKQEQVMHWFANKVSAGQVHWSKIRFNIRKTENSRILTKNARSSAFLRGGAPLYNNVTNETISYQNKNIPSSHKSYRPLVDFVWFDFEGIMAGNNRLGRIGPTQPWNVAGWAVQAALPWNRWTE